ncbi:MAG: GHKL domain-containing protein [Hungatella sp.]|nr:GHKL domain-containing protein [Hungatella sp.]
MAKNLQFKTNSRHIGQLGRELVTDFVTALVELVKNAYDADAPSVRIMIENANTPHSRIIVADTGCGMTEDEFENRWMVIGTSNKLSLPYTPKGRKKAGKKGIGRFSVERLAERAVIYSYTAEETFKVFLNWNLYEEISVAGLQQRIQILRNKNDVSAAKYIANQLEYYFSLKLKGNERVEQEYVREKVGGVIGDYEAAYKTDFLELFENEILPILKKQERVELKLENIDNPMEGIGNRESEETYKILQEMYAVEGREKLPMYTGLVMVLEGLRDNWRQKDIEKLQKELRLLIAPEFIEKDPFHIELIANQFKIPEEISVNSILDLRYAKVTARIYDNGTRSEIRYSDITGKNEEKNMEYEMPLLCGDVTFELYYFLRDSIHMTNETYNYRLAIGILNIYCGIKIYRDNFRVKPYGDVDNDWLGLDKAKVSDTHGYRVGNNQTIGVIKISDEKNPLLIDATNREGIIENEAYEHLKKFVLTCIELITTIRWEEYEKSKSELEKAKEQRQKQKQRARKQKTVQERRYEDTLQLLKSGASYETVASSLEQWKAEEEKRQKETEEEFEKTEKAYEKYVEMQETELSMYKNLATLGILTGNFGHETQDIISRIDNTLSFYTEIAPMVENKYFAEITENVKSDFTRISGYSLMIVEFLRKKKRSPHMDLNFGEVLRDICRLYQGMLEAFHVDLQLKTGEDICLTMRQIDLESIIINMITNAFEQVKARQQKKIQIIFEQRDEDTYLYFEDSGPGVPENMREEIFKPFITTKEDGIGLGLNIVRDIVTNYGGKVHAEESKELGGAKFVVHFMKEDA